MKERPHRVQLSRRKGWKMPPDTIKVDRTTKWGNPYTEENLPPHAMNAAEAFEQWCNLSIEGAWMVHDARAELAGKNLACWCPLLDKNGNRVPCHADVLLEIANRD